MNRAKELIKLIEEDRPELPDADELVLYIDNNEPIYRMKVDAFKNLAKKKKAGTYDPSLAPKLMMYVVEAGAKGAAKSWSEYNEIDPPMPWNKVYSMEVRQEAAQELVQGFEAAFDNKEYDFMK